MPLRCRPPREGKRVYSTVRGIHRGVYVEKSSGTAERSLARRNAENLERAIERGEYPYAKSATPQTWKSCRDCHGAASVAAAPPPARMSATPPKADVKAEAANVS